MSSYSIIRFSNPEDEYVRFKEILFGLNDTVLKVGKKQESNMLVARIKKTKYHNVFFANSDKIAYL